MILVDTGPLVALFDPADSDHKLCVSILKNIEAPLGTTVPVLTEAFHLLDPGSIGAQRLMDFVIGEGIYVSFLNDQALVRSFELMVRYADHPMNLADASLVALAETLRLRKVFTIDRSDFTSYRVKRGHQYVSFEILS